MKKALKITGYSLIGIIVLIIAISTISYQNYWADDPQVEVNPEQLQYFRESYPDCREAFRDAVANIPYDSIRAGGISINSKVDSDLTVDWCYIPAKIKNKRLLILNSGLHGIEGYTGSAIQLMFLDKILDKLSRDSLGILLVHGLNPYGFKYHRKVTENNVDLNRNCVIDTAMYHSRNTGYAALTDLLMPQDEVNINSLTNRFFHIVAIKKIIEKSMPVLRQAALQGQYDFDKGIYYGGKDYEPQIKALEPLFKDIMNQYPLILNVDLHTAYGERGTMHLFLNPVDNDQVKRGLESIFEGEKIDWGNSKDFYTINGEYLGWVNHLADTSLCLPMLFEFGTLDSQTTFGSLKSIQIMINENQGAHYGFKNEKSEKKVKHDFDEMYYPSSEKWRTKVMNDAYNKISRMVKRFEEYNLNK